MSRTSRQVSGDQAEALAEQFLHRNRLTTLLRNYRCRLGEIDLVMLDASDAPPEIVVFVEVRSRSLDGRVSALESVDERKQGKLILTARHFLAARPEFQELPCRFDVVGFDAPDQPPRWVRNAFEVDF